MRHVRRPPLRGRAAGAKAKDPVFSLDIAVTVVLEKLFRRTLSSSHCTLVANSYRCKPPHRGISSTAAVPLIAGVAVPAMSSRSVPGTWCNLRQTKTAATVAAAAICGGAS